MDRARGAFAEGIAKYRPVRFARDYFGLAIDNEGTTHLVWGEGRDYKAPGSIWYTRGR